MKKDVTVFINHILDSIGKIEEFTEGVTKENFLGAYSFGYQGVSITHNLVCALAEQIRRVPPRNWLKVLAVGQFLKSVQLQDAVIRRLEIIGEAVKNIPAEFRRKHLEIPWSELARMRDKLIHGYFGVDLELTWDIAKKDLPVLKGKIKKIL